MKNQRKKTEARNFRFSAVAVVLLMLATLVCCFTVLASADTAKITVDLDDLTFGETIKVDTTGGYYKVYDGKTTADITVKDPTLGIEAADQAYVELVVESAAFNSKDVESADKITVTFKVQLKDGVSADKSDLLDKYTAPRALTLAAKVKPATLSWASGVAANVTYVPGRTTYNATVTAPALNGMVNNESAPSVTASTLTATVNGVSGVDTYDTTVDVTLNSKNYVVAPLAVTVTVDPVVITKITWTLPKTAFEWGDAELDQIAVTGFDAQDNPYALAITYGEGFGNVGTYTLTAVEPNDNYTIGQSVSDTTSITINKKVFDVTFADTTYIGNAGIQADPTEYMLTVDGDIPADIRALITYTVNGAAFTGASEYGTYTVTANLPSDSNYEFKGVTDGKLTATMMILKAYINAGTADAPYLLILVNENGFASDISASVTIPEINRRALRGFRHAHAEYTLNVTGAAGETFTVLIPISDTLYGKRLSELTAADLYIYEEANGTMTSATELNYTVTVKDGYFQIEGVSGSAAITFVLAPEYNAPFWLTAPGIALLILLVLALIALLLLIGLYLHRVHLSKKNEEMVIDTEGEVPAVVPAEDEDNVDVDAVLEENADQLADELANEVDAEAAEENTEGLEEAVAESMEELMDDVSAIELEKEVVEETVDETVDETDVAAEMADEMADRLQDTVETEDVEAEADEDALRAAVADALAENFNESADASDAIAIVAAVEEDSDEITPEDFRAVVDAIVSDAMCNTMDLPEAVEETVEETTEEAVEETAEEAVADEAEIAEDAAEEIVVEEMSNDDICAIVADSVAEAFELVSVDGVAPKAVEGTTVETITEAVNNAADANIPETWTEAMAAAVKEAVVDELAARLIVEVEEEPAVEAFAEIVEEKPETDEDDNDNDNDNDNDDDEDDEGFGGFGSMPLDFIDAVAEADKYAAMLEDERNGFVRIVTRYKRSFQSRLSQSQGNVQEYYNIIKNALLSYKGVKNRISWNYEAFNRGRTHVAKINAKTKTLYLYLALDPAELVDTKYGIVDMSSKKKYASVPVLMKIKGERKFKYALELIEKLCGENLTLPKLENEEVDYRIPYQTTEELVEAGIVKKLVASVPIVYSEADPAPEAAAEETTASATAEAQEVTFVAPTDAPAVEAAAEEVAAEEIPANAEASEGENKEI